MVAYPTRLQTLPSNACTWPEVLFFTQSTSYQYKCTTFERWVRNASRNVAEFCVTGPFWLKLKGKQTYQSKWDVGLWNKVMARNPALVTFRSQEVTEKRYSSQVDMMSPSGPMTSPVGQCGMIAWPWWCSWTRNDNWAELFQQCNSVWFLRIFLIK